MKIMILLVLLFLSVNLYSKNTITEEVSKNINRAEAYFEYGNYQESIKILEKLLNDRSKLNSSSLLNIYQLIARAEYYNKDYESAEFYLKLLYLFKSNYHFDPVFINPKFIDFANKIYGKYKEEIIKSKEDLSMLLRKKHPEKYGNIKTEKKFYKNFLPFGFGQFQNGHKYKGYMIIGLEAISLVTSVTTYALLKYYQNDDYTFDNEDLAYSGKVVNNVAFSVFMGVYLYGVIDGIVYYNASDIDIIQSKKFEILPILTSDLKYVVFKWKF